MMMAEVPVSIGKILCPLFLQLLTLSQPKEAHNKPKRNRVKKYFK
jgi:hypothetical protein